MLPGVAVHNVHEMNFVEMVLQGMGDVDVRDPRVKPAAQQTP